MTPTNGTNGDAAAGAITKALSAVKAQFDKIRELWEREGAPTSGLAVVVALLTALIAIVAIIVLGSTAIAKMSAIPVGSDTEPAITVDHVIRWYVISIVAIIGTLIFLGSSGK